MFHDNHVYTNLIISQYESRFARGRVALCENFLEEHQQVIIIAFFVFLCSLLQIGL